MDLEQMFRKFMKDLGYIKDQFGGAYQDLRNNTRKVVDYFGNTVPGVIDAAAGLKPGDPRPKMSQQEIYGAPGRTFRTLEDLAKR